MAISLVGIAGLLYYEWGAHAPGYEVWSGMVPWPIHGLLRERYAISFIILFALTVLMYRGAVVLLGLSLRLGAIAIAIALVAGVAPFLDGHLGPFGTVRERFDAATTLTNYINGHGGGVVLTVPFGSVVRGPNWAYFGRSPFSIGGPALVLDTEGSPTAPALPMVQALARSLTGDAALNSGASQGYVKLLEVRYVVEWQQLNGDMPLDLPAVRSNLAKLGAQPVWSDREATLWELPGAPAAPLPQERALYARDGRLPDELFRILAPLLVLLTVAMIGGSLIPDRARRTRSAPGGAAKSEHETEAAGLSRTYSDEMMPTATPSSPPD
jgi:hypothetical protein